VPTTTSIRPEGHFVFNGLPPGFTAAFSSRRLVPDGTSGASASQRLAIALGYENVEIARVFQVHGNTVAEINGRAIPGRNELNGEADALVTNEPERLLVISTADCVPVVLADPGTGWIAAIHAGWRGTAKRVVTTTIEHLRGKGCDPARIVARVGPSIRGEAYEVGPEVISAIRQAFPNGTCPPQAITPGRGDRSLLDVGIINEAELREAGILPQHIRRPDFCTARDQDLFPSYRRDGPRAGRIVTGIIRQP
jgi:YfiH family protein